MQLIAKDVPEQGRTDLVADAMRHLGPERAAVLLFLGIPLVVAGPGPVS